MRKEGDWEAWITFFTEAVRETARQGVSTANRLTEIVEEDRVRTQSLKRLSGSALRVLNVLARTPVVTVAKISRETGIVESSVSKALKAMMKLGLVKELTGGKRNRLFCYDRYMKILSEGMEPLT